MRLARSDGDRLVFRLGKVEKALLLEIVKLYPLVPAGYERARNPVDPAKAAGDLQLLEEALKEHRAENRRQVLAMLNEPDRFAPCARGYRLILTPGQAEWLLQVVNDVRVGSWIAIGSPDEKLNRPAKVDSDSISYVFALEVSGIFETALLEALAGPAPDAGTNSA